MPSVLSKAILFTWRNSKAKQCHMKYTTKLNRKINITRISVYSRINEHETFHSNLVKYHRTLHAILIYGTKEFKTTMKWKTRGKKCEWNSPAPISKALFEKWKEIWLHFSQLKKKNTMQFFTIEKFLLGNVQTRFDASLLVLIYNINPACASRTTNWKLIEK